MIPAAGPPCEAEAPVDTLGPEVSMPTSLVVFDLDGTLVDTLPDSADVINGVLADEGFPVHPTRSYAGFVGWGLRRALERTLPEPLDEDRLQDMLGRIVRTYSERPARLSEVYPGIPELLDDLSSRGFESVVFTNKTEQIAAAVVEALFPANMFRDVVGQRDGVPAKPDPTALNERLGHPSLRESSILLVGDTPIDVETARNAGIPFAGAAWGFRSRADLLKAGSERVFDAPRDLHRWMIEEYGG